MPRPRSPLANCRYPSLSLSPACVYARSIRTHGTRVRVWIGYGSIYRILNVARAYETKSVRSVRAAPRRVFGPREEALGIRMNKHGSQVEGGIEKGRTQRGAKMNYGGMRRKMFRTSACFPTAIVHPTRLPSRLRNDRHAISKKEGKKGTIARSTATSVLRLDLTSNLAACPK